ncbi:MAG: AAA family ATPase [Phycisphaerae bacterium]|nr:AAA family ATPase [Phycisphaerae bacterium]
MLKKLKLHNFRTFLNAEIEFTRRHLVIGSNNSGKTNLCSALRFFAATAYAELTKSAQAIPGGIKEIKNWAFDSQEIEISCTCALPFENELFDFTYDLGLRLESSSDFADRGQIVLRVSKEQLLISGPGFPNVSLLENDGREAQMLHEENYLNSGETHPVTIVAPRDATMLSKLYELPTNPRAILFRKYLSSWVCHAFSPEHMRFGCQDVSPAVRGLVTRGDNLAIALYHMKNLDEQRYRRVIDHARIIEPTLEAINFVLAPDQTPLPFVALSGRSRASWAGLSDGTLRCLGLAVIIELVAVWRADMGSPAPLIAIEEPENGIYPGQLRKIFDLFEERAPGEQFIFTSHNPYFIDFFDGARDSVTILRRKNERTEILSAPPAEDDPDRLTLAEQYAMELIG